MQLMLERFAAVSAGAQGIFCAEQFQMAYVTNDLDRACDLFKDQLGLRAFTPLGGPMPDGGEMQARFAWVGPMMLELIQASGPGSGIFMDRLEGADGFTIRHHHLGFLVRDRAEWQGILANAADKGWAVPWRSSNVLVDACFIAVPPFEHYCEYLLPTAAGMQFFNSVTRS